MVHLLPLFIVLWDAKIKSKPAGRPAGSGFQKINKGNRLSIFCHKLERNSTCQVKTNPASSSGFVCNL